MNKKDLKQSKDALDAAKDIPATDRYSGGDSIGADNTSAFPTEINENGELVTKYREEVEEGISLKQPQYNAENPNQLQSATYHKLSKKIKKNFTSD